MNANIAHWRAQLVHLSPSERAELAHFLLTSPEPEDEDVETACDVEASRRVKEIRAGDVIGRPVDELLAELP